MTDGFPLQLTGWSQARRIVVLRRRVRGSMVAEVKADSLKGQQTLLFADAKDDLKLWEHTVLITNTDYTLEAVGQRYRDRADCENGFDELKNQWGWGGYTTHDLERCNLSARAVALIYNWWSWCVRLAHPTGVFGNSLFKASTTGCKATPHWRPDSALISTDAPRRKCD